MIKFKKVRFKNFFNFGNDFIEIDIENFDFVCVTGENGVGKSTIIIESIFFALFGKSFRKINKPNIVNNINGKNCEVHLWFEKNKDSYFIKRGIKPNILYIYKNNSEKPIESKSSDTELQNYIEDKILQFNDKIFKQVCLFGSALYVPYLELDLPQRRLIVENLLGLEIFSNIQIVSKDRIKAINLKINENENEMEKLQSELGALQRALEEVKKDNQKQITGYQDNIKQLENTIRGYNIKIGSEKIGIELLEKENDTILKKGEKYEKQLKEGEELLNERVMEADRYETENTMYNKQLKQLEGKSECPLCHSKADNFENLLKEWNDKIKENVEKIKKLGVECKEINDIIEKVKEKTSGYTNKINENKNQIESRKQNISVTKTKKENCEITITEYTNKIEEFKNKTIIDEDEIKNKEDRVMEYIRVLEELRKNLKYYNHVKDITSDKGIKTYIIQKYIPIINNRINHYLEKFELGFGYEFDDQFNDKIVSRIKEGIVFNGLSQGQKSRINFSIMFSFIYIAQLLNSVNCDILFMDEVLDSSSLDDIGVEKLLGLIKNIADEEGKRIYVISHSEKTKDLFDRKITVNWNGLFGRVMFT